MRECTHGPDGRTCMDMVDFDRVAKAAGERCPGER
jgi:hypothetical protein